MEIFFKNNENQLQQTTIQGVLTKIMQGAKLEYENFTSSDDDTSTLTLTKRVENKARIDIQLEFDDIGEKLTGFSVFKTPIEIIENTGEMKKIV